MILKERKASIQKEQELDDLRNRRPLYYNRVSKDLQMREHQLNNREQQLNNREIYLNNKENLLRGDSKEGQQMKESYLNNSMNSSRMSRFSRSPGMSNSKRRKVNHYSNSSRSVEHMSQNNSLYRSCDLGGPRASIMASEGEEHISQEHSHHNCSYHLDVDKHQSYKKERKEYKENQRVKMYDQYLK